MTQRQSLKWIYLSVDHVISFDSYRHKNMFDLNVSFNVIFRRKHVEMKIRSLPSSLLVVDDAGLDGTLLLLNDELRR